MIGDPKEQKPVHTQNNEFKSSVMMYRVKYQLPLTEFMWKIYGNWYVPVDVSELAQINIL